MYIDIRCDDLSTPANGEIMSCSSDMVGVGYEGDTCSFTCNTGYELTGSDTRTCQSNGSWSSTDISCKRGIMFFKTNFSITMYYIAKSLSMRHVANIVGVIRVYTVEHECLCYCVYKYMYIYAVVSNGIWKL